MEFAIKKDGVYTSVPFNSRVIQTQGKGSITLQAKVGDGEFSNYMTIDRRDKVTKLEFPIESLLRLTSKQPFTYIIPGMFPWYYGKRKVEDYLYEITYGNIDYPYAYQYFKPSEISGGCSVVRNASYVGRNFDWKYDNSVQFIVNTPSSLEHFAVIGISGLIPGINKTTVDQNDVIVDGTSMFKLVPFYLLDGINERGVFCMQNVVPLDNPDDPTREIVAEKEEFDRVCIPMLTRFILDKFATAEEAIRYLRDHTTLFFSDEMIDSGYQSHFMLGDTNSTYILEFIDGKMNVLSKNRYITNFNISGVEFSPSHTIQYPPTEYGMNKYGFGLERWDIITREYAKTSDPSKMRDLLEKLKYSNTYSDPFWKSEIVKALDDSGNPITVDTDISLCSDAIDEARSNYENRDRDEGNTWITVHSSIYDIVHKKLYVKNQEGDIEYTFTLQK